MNVEDECTAFRLFTSFTSAEHQIARYTFPSLASSICALIRCERSLVTQQIESGACEEGRKKKEFGIAMENETSLDHLL